MSSVSKIIKLAPLLLAGVNGLDDIGENSSEIKASVKAGTFIDYEAVLGADTVKDIRDNENWMWGIVKDIELVKQWTGGSDNLTEAEREQILFRAVFLCAVAYDLQHYTTQALKPEQSEVGPRLDPK